MATKAVWHTKRLGELAEFRNGVNYNKSSFGMGMKVVGVSDFQDYSKPRYAELEQINPGGIATERNILRDGDIVFVRSNGNRMLIGRSLFIEKPPEDVTHSAFTIRLRFTTSEVLPKFYAYYFRTPLIRQALTAQGGGTNINNLNQDMADSNLKCNTCKPADSNLKCNTCKPVRSGNVCKTSTLRLLRETVAP